MGWRFHSSLLQESGFCLAAGHLIVQKQMICLATHQLSLSRLPWFPLNQWIFYIVNYANISSTLVNFGAFWPYPICTCSRVPSLNTWFCIMHYIYALPFYLIIVLGVSWELWFIYSCHTPYNEGLWLEGDFYLFQFDAANVISTC